ncbi:hypothetical protein [Luteimonas deserti]|uniref:Uncharacterized protein n=1 Tax=Luteimonas deserti TaxID=2752306 RepID=A0A7Z0QQS3_9GAMM|nr:hypothetical protein [Luteimonas deserti]NYZ63132.1 hypothetical protein [Luteimonas deserti]
MASDGPSAASIPSLARSQAQERIATPPDTRRDAPTLRRLPQAEPAFDAADEDQPPASADSPEVQRAWLERVRELLDAGEIAAARASLAEFHRRYPRAELPADLRALLD